MSDTPERMDGVLARMGRGVVPVDPAERERVRRAKIGEALDERIVELGLAEKSRQRLYRALLFAAAAVTCLLAAGLVRSRFWVPGTSAPTVAMVEPGRAIDLLHAGRHTVLDRGPRPVEPEDEISVPGGSSATIHLARGARVDARERSRIRFVPADTPEGHVETLELASGSVELRVPKLPSGDELRVKTADATVTVRGTQFRVTIEPGALPWTTVEVLEGSVWVTSKKEGDLILRAGASWSSGPEPEPAPSVAAAPAASVAGSRTATGSPGGESAPHAEPRPSVVGATSAPAARGSAEFDAAPESAPPPSDENSTLAAENELYRRAVFAARAGDEAAALRQLETFVATFPRSPLAENAKVERLRVLLRLGMKPAAARAARAYLAEYPGGFARDEARRVAEGTLQGEP